MSQFFVGSDLFDTLLNAKPEIQILNWLYPWHEWCGKCNCLKPHKSSWYQEFFARFALSLSFDRVVKLAARNIFQVKELQEWNWYKDYLLYRMKFWQKNYYLYQILGLIWFLFLFQSCGQVEILYHNFSSFEGHFLQKEEDYRISLISIRVHKLN